MLIGRRTFLRGFIAAPVIVAAANIMPVRGLLKLAAPEGPDFMVTTRPVYDELIAITRRVWIPKLTTQLYKPNPLLARLQAKTTAEFWGVT